MFARQPSPSHSRSLAVLPRPLAGSIEAGRLTDPTPEEFRRAIEGNQRLLLLRTARYGGERIERIGGVQWHDGSKEAGEIHIPFPRFDRDRAGDQLDEVLIRLVRRSTARAVRIWSPDPPRPAALPAILMARGFRPGFRPRWMRLDLWRLRDVRWGPAGLRVERLGDSGVWDDHPHPSLGDHPAGRAAVRTGAAAALALPDHLIHFAAWLDGRAVGAATLHLTGGPLGIAGVYDVGVLPEFRNRGIGKAVTNAACRAAWARGYQAVGLNATILGEPVYRRLGFEPAGDGQTWELPAEALAAGRPSPDHVAFAEAIASGDLATLGRLDERLPIDVFDVGLACGLTPIQLAARFSQRGAAEWLRGRGASVDLLSAWDLGWRKRTLRTLAEQPELANERRGQAGATPLHDAVERGDVELASLLLAAGADPAIRDEAYDATPLDWARHFGRAELVALLDEAAFGD